MPSTSTVPNAGLFDVNADCKFKCTIRKGDIKDNPRGGTAGEFLVKISEGLDVVKAKAISFVQRKIKNSQLITEDVN